MNILRKVKTKIINFTMDSFEKIHKKRLRKKKYYSYNLYLYNLALHGMGVLNYENSEVSGEKYLLENLLKNAPEHSVVIDVGANVGNYAKKCMEINSTISLIAFEPHPKTFFQLKAVSEVNGFRAINKGCGEENDTLLIYDYAENNGSSHASLYEGVIENIHQAKKISTEVQIIKMDDFATKEKIDHIYLLKIDTEGHELSVLKGIKALIEKQCIDYIQFEFNEMNTISKTFLRDFSEILNDYKFYRLLSDGVVPVGENTGYNSYLFEIFAFQNILAVRKDLVNNNELLFKD